VAARANMHWGIGSIMLLPVLLLLIVAVVSRAGPESR